MNNFTKCVVSCIITLFFVGCAATYQPPTVHYSGFARNINATKEHLFNTAKQALILNGYQIASSDKEAGVISTAQKQLDLTEADCDCGTTMGIPYIKDKRTTTNVAVGIIISSTRIAIKSTIEGEYLKGNTTQGIDLHCVSKGVIEQNIYNSVSQLVEQNAN